MIIKNQCKVGMFQQSAFANYDDKGSLPKHTSTHNELFSRYRHGYEITPLLKCCWLSFIKTVKTNPKCSKCTVLELRTDEFYPPLF